MVIVIGDAGRNGNDGISEVKPTLDSTGLPPIQAVTRFGGGCIVGDVDGGGGGGGDGGGGKSTALTMSSVLNNNRSPADVWEATVDAGCGYGKSEDQRNRDIQGTGVFTESHSPL